MARLKGSKAPAKRKRWSKAEAAPQPSDDAVAVARFVDRDLAILRELTPLVEQARREELERYSERCREPHRGLPMPHVVVEDYVRAGGVPTTSFPRRSIHGQEIADWLERHGWKGNAERLDACFRHCLRLELVEPPPLRVGDTPPWCSTYGMSLRVWTDKQADRVTNSHRPACCWWDLKGSRPATEANSAHLYGGDD